MAILTGKFVFDKKEIVYQIGIKSFKEYSVERFSEVLNVQHHYSTFLLIDEFYL